MMHYLTPACTFAFYAVVCLAAWATVDRIYPETAGLRLEDVAGLLERDWGVQRSVRVWRDRRRIT